MSDPTFQSEATRQGQVFEDQASAFLRSLGFSLQGSKKIDHVGCQIDQAAIGPNGKKVFFEFKGSYRGPRPGMRRTDTVKKGLLTGFLLQSVGDPTPYYILTSHLPLKGAALAMIQRAIESGAVAGVLEVNTPEAQSALAEYFGSLGSV